jgi:membrane protein YdbS with pleckstrin-like domain
MYANMGTIEVNHGGLTLEEMVVPYIKISNG